MAFLPAIAALATGGISAISAAKRNKKRPSYDYKPYEGLRPPETKFLRPVEEQITNILMNRSKGIDVGYSPERRNALLESYDLGRKKDMDRSKTDINDRLSGMGLSRNLKAVDALYNRQMEDYQTAKDKYVTDVDIEDLARQNEERDVNTGRLQNLNQFNFGQENARADFDLDIYNAQNQDRARAYGSQVDAFDRYRDPLGEAIQAGLGTYSTLNGMPSSSPKMTESLPSNVKPSDALYKGSKGYQDDYSDIMNSNKLRYAYNTRGR